MSSNGGTGETFRVCGRRGGEGTRSQVNILDFGGAVCRGRLTASILFRFISDQTSSMPPPPPACLAIESHHFFLHSIIPLSLSPLRHRHFRLRDRSSRSSPASQPHHADVNTFL